MLSQWWGKAGGVIGGKPENISSELVEQEGIWTLWGGGGRGGGEAWVEGKDVGTRGTDELGYGEGTQCRGKDRYWCSFEVSQCQEGAQCGWIFSGFWHYRQGCVGVYGGVIVWMESWGISTTGGQIGV